MDAHVFRRVAPLLAARLRQARIERIHSPLDDVTVFTLFGSGAKFRLVVRAHRSRPLLFITAPSPLPNPAFPPAFVMRLRKYAEGAVIREVAVDWASRRMALDLGTGTLVMLDVRKNPTVISGLPDGFGSPPVWPDPGNLDPDDWQRYPVLTPALRRRLATLDSRDAAALLVDLESGEGDLFWSGSGLVADAVSAWPSVPVSGRWEKAVPVDGGQTLALLEAMELPLLLEVGGALNRQPELIEEKRSAKRRKRLAAALEAEKKRLTAMLALGDTARLIQANLWRLDADRKTGQVILPTGLDNGTGAEAAIDLDPRLTVGQNMERMFRKAAKANRGLKILEQRLGAAERDDIPRRDRPVSPSTKSNVKTGLGRVQQFRSSDGFLMWRGKNAQGNRDLLKLALPFDLWFHDEDGPSAHLVVRRDHAAQAVPENTYREAAMLVGLKSWRRHDPKAKAMVALVKHVQPVKGAPAGTVTVARQERSVIVDIDGQVEKKLAVHGP